MTNPQDLKKALVQALAEKGEYSTILKHLDTDEKKEKGERVFKLIEPFSAFADMLTSNTNGVFMEKLTEQLDATTKENLEKLSKDITEAKNTLSDELQALLSTTKSELVAEHLSRYQEAEKMLTEKLMQMAVEVVSSKADEILPALSAEAKLTEEEINDIIEASSFSVESQINSIIGEYIAEFKINTEQIVGFSEAVKKILPPERQVSWGEIVGKPDMSQGGTNANLIRSMIAELATGIPNGGTTGQVLTKASNDDGDAEWTTVAGTGDALVANPLSQFAATTSLQLKGVISDETGSGALVFANTPTLVTPVIGAATGTSLQLSGLTASEIVITDGSKNLASAPVATYPSLAELAHVKGVTSAVQTQLNAKAPTTAPTFATSITGSYLTASEVLITDASKNVVSAPAATYPSLTELTYVKGVTSAIQTQLNGKAASLGADDNYVTDAEKAIIAATTASYTTAEASKLSGIEASADVTDATNVGAVNAAAASKATPVDADSFPIVNSESSNVIGRATFTNFKAFLKTYFDTLYQPLATVLTNTTAAFTTALESKLNGIEASADVTDATNVTAAGALMDSELTDIAAVKALADGAASDVNTGTSTTMFVTPDALAGSNFGIRYFPVALNGSTALTTSDKFYFRVPAGLTGMNLVSVSATVGTGAAGSSSSGTPTFTVKNVTDNAQMLSTSLTVDANEYTSATAATAAVINTATDDIISDDLIEVAVTTAGTGVSYAVVTLGFQLP